MKSDKHAAPDAAQALASRTAPAELAADPQFKMVMPSGQGFVVGWPGGVPSRPKPHGRSMPECQEK